MSPMNTIEILGLRQEARAKSWGELESQTRAKQIMLATSFLKLNLEAFKGNTCTSLVK